MMKIDIIILELDKVIFLIIYHWIIVIQKVITKKIKVT